MLIKKIKFFLVILLLYQTPSYSKSSSFGNFDSKNLSKYFSGIVALENSENSKALDFFKSSKVLIDKHDPYLRRYIFSLVLEKKIPHAINILRSNKKKNNSKFFDAYLILILDDLKKGNFDKALKTSKKAINFSNNKFESAILKSLKQYIFVFKEKKILNNEKNLGELSIITETFQRCYLDDERTDIYFTNLFSSASTDYTRYIFFYLSYLIENKNLVPIKEILDDIDFMKSPLLLSQAKSWIKNDKKEKIVEFFSCKNHNDLISEFLFLISNLYSSEENFEKSNFYLNLSNYLNPKFIFNLSLVAENQFFNKDYQALKKTLKNFKKENIFYYWYRIKKEAKIISKLNSQKDSIDFVENEFDKIENPNNKIIFDIANFYRNSKEYKKAIKFYTKILNVINENSDIKFDLLYRRGSCFERIGDFEKADKDLLASLKINADDAYVLNYLAYSWLERNFKINDAMEMLKIAYEAESDDPYIIDSIGWAYFLTADYTKAEEFLKRAVELMPDDPIVNDHYGDVLWKLGQKIQARYFWTSALKMDDADDEMKKKINIKIFEGLENS